MNNMYNLLPLDPLPDLIDDTDVSKLINAKKILRQATESTPYALETLSKFVPPIQKDTKLEDHPNLMEYVQHHADVERIIKSEIIQLKQLNQFIYFVYKCNLFNQVTTSTPKTSV